MKPAQFSGLLLLGVYSILSPTLATADIKNGKELHDANCISCHAAKMGGDGTGIYTRDNSRIETYPALVKQVHRCRDSLGIPWPTNDVNDVVEYLNKNFYKFKK